MMTRTRFSRSPVARTLVARTLVALLLGAGGGVVASSGTAFAAACPAGTGVTVVVNSSTGCDGSGGGSAASNFGAAGHSLAYIRGFVCQIDGAPSGSPCRQTPPSDAYWGLFWADGTGGGWNYSAVGAGSLKVPAGGWVAFVFQSSNNRTYPSMTPYTAPPAPAPKPKATTSQPKKKAPTTPQATSSAGGASTAAPSASPSAGASPAATASSPGAESATSPSPSPVTSSAAAEAREEALERTSQQTDESSGTLWVGIVLALALLTGMGVTVWQRRARRS